MAHNLAMAVGIEIPDGQRLHMREHIVPDLFEHALRDHHHQPVVQVSGCDAGQIDTGHHQHRAQKPRKVRHGGRQQRRNIAVDQRSQKQ